MEAFVCITLLVAAVAVRLWAGFAWQDVLDGMPESQRRELIRRLGRAGY